MNTTAHLAGAACAAYGWAFAATRRTDPPLPGSLVVLVAAGLGLLSHFVLDLTPHYAWIANIEWFPPFPYRWLVNEAILGAVVAIPALLLASGARWPVAIGMLGGLYPDWEKVLSLDFHIPDRYVLFAWHSSHLSHRTGGLPKPVLVEFECALVLACLAVMWAIRKGLKTAATPVASMEAVAAGRGG